MKLCFLFFGNNHADDSKCCQSNGTEEPVVGAYDQFSDHEWVHRATGDITAKAKGAWLVGNKGQGRRLTRVSFDRNIVAVHIQSVNYICADKLDVHFITSVNFKFGGKYAN